jgi:orotidine-5'-phosphate decarboxylase
VSAAAAALPKDAGGATRRRALRDRLIVGLDVDSLKAAEAVVRRLGETVRFYKIGKQLFVAAGPDAVRMVRAHGAEVFLDLKFHDIPNTVAMAGVAAARLGVRLFNVHASGGVDMMARTAGEVARVCRCDGLRRPQILGVTVLTSIAGPELASVGVRGTVEAQVTRLARLARTAGLDGVVASSLEVARVRRVCGRRFLVVTPGIRPPGASRQDQRRVLGPADAIAAGADYLVVARPILDAPDPVAAARVIIADMARGAQKRLRSPNRRG